MAAFPSGTKTFFNQTSAPTGWTKNTSDTDYTLRIISGTPAGVISGSVDFSTCMADKPITGTVPTVTSTVSSNAADLPAHTHTIYYANINTINIYYQPYPGGTSTPYYLNPRNQPGFTNSGGNGVAHTHTMNVSGSSLSSTSVANLSVRYLDFILATKN